MPFCDYVDYNTINQTYRTYPTTISKTTFEYNNGRYCYRMQTWTRPVFFVFPYLTNTTVGNTKLTFECKVDNAGSAIEIGVLTDLLDTTSFVPIDTLVCNSTGWHRVYIDLSSYTGNGRWIAFRAKSPMLNGDFYFDDLQLDICYVTAVVNVRRERYTDIVIDGNIDPEGNGPFWVEYGQDWFQPGQGTLLRIDSLPTRLSLAPATTYGFYIYCSNNRQQCYNYHIVSTLDLPMVAPSCTNFENGVVGYTPQGWTPVNGPIVISNATAHTGSKSLVICGTAATPVIDVDSLNEIALGVWVKATQPGAYLIVGSMTNPTYSSSFHPLKTIVPKQIGVWEYHFISLADAPSNAHYIAFRNASGNNNNIFIDDLLLTRCTAFDLRISNFDNTAIELSWHQIGNPDAIIKVVDNTTNQITEHNISSQEGQSMTIPITPQHDYQITAFFSCDEEAMMCAEPYRDTINIAVPAGGFGCVDPTDLNSPQAIFFSGTYNNPYAYRGAIDFGNSQAASRHTINYDTTARDPRTGNLLRTIPKGYTSSVRLGNWSTNPSSPEAEGVIYSFRVDTLNFALLLMHYAAVLQDPMHAPEDQPRFRLELLDSNFLLIDRNCAAADFIANRNLGWNVAPDNVLWKDWTTVGVDLTAYQGQQVYLRLTTYDCNEGSHYGYAYFTLECMLKNIRTETCGYVDSNQFSAPAGFNYRWYTTTDNTTLSTDQTLVVPTAQSTVYLCDLSFVGNPSCQFTLSAFGGARYPLARVDTVVTYSNCRINVKFLNRSTVSEDGINPVSTGESAETAYWDFGNGLSSDSYNGYTTYDQPGTYIVTLIVGISGGECNDTLVFPITVDFPLPPLITGPNQLCYGERDTLRLYNATFENPSWLQGNGFQFLPLSPANYHIGDNSFNLMTTDIYGCTPTLTHTLHINPTYTHIDSITICEPMLPYSYADTIFLPGTVTCDYHQIEQSNQGCDSSFHLHLKVSPVTANTALDTVEASICDNEYYSFFGTSYNTAGEHLVDHIDSLGRCDSLHSLMLDVRPTSAVDTIANACDRFTWYGNLFFVDTIVAKTDQNIYLCDSTTTLHLFIHPSYDIKDPIVICPNQRYIYEGVDYGGPIAFDSPHVSIYDCDSIVHVELYPSNPLFPAPPIASIDNMEWYSFDTLFLGCDPQHIHLKDTSISVSRSWTMWNTDDPSYEFSSSDREFNPLVDTVGLFAVQLITVSEEGCIDTIGNDSLLWVYASPVADFFWSPDHLSIHSPEAQFFNQSSPEGLSYLWLFPHDPSASICDSSIEVNPSYAWEINTEPGEYPVSLIAYYLHHGPDTLTIVCSDTATIPVNIVNTYLQFPNSVTPNGDGINDRWIIVNLLEMGEYSMNELWIYDHWGALVYHVKNISKPSDFWDPLETRSPDGTYYFRFSAKNNFGIVRHNGVIEVSR